MRAAIACPFGDRRGRAVLPRRTLEARIRMDHRRPWFRLLESRSRSVRKPPNLKAPASCKAPEEQKELEKDDPVEISSTSGTDVTATPVKKRKSRELEHGRLESICSFLWPCHPQPTETWLRQQGILLLRRLRVSRRRLLLLRVRL